MNSSEVWQKIKLEVEALARSEPVLASFLHISVLSHEDFCSALSHNLADQLGNNVVSPLALRQVFDRQLRNHPDTIRQAIADIEACFDRDPACDLYAMPLLYFKGYRALQAYRLSHSLWLDGNRDLALYLQGRVSELFDVDIHPAAKIGSAVMLDHATGIVIGETAVVEDEVSMLHSVTLGGTGHESGDRHPKIRRGVLIAAGAKVLGNIEVGEGAKIGAGSLVLEPVAPHTTVAGVPAKSVGGTLEGSPALDMDQHLMIDGGGI
ncbi:MAG: serine O-acetyltransferase [bacterium]